MNEPTDQDALTLTHAIALQESGGGSNKPNYNAVGDAGTSHGAYQWQPGNFEAAAKKYGLDPNDKSPMNQDKVAYKQVKEMKDRGLDPGQIASSWNSGSPNNWKDHSGTTVINGKSIHYDTPAYVKGVQKYYQQLKGQQSAPQVPQGQAQGQSQDKGFLENEGKSVSNRLSEGGNAIADTITGKINPISGVLQTVGAAAGGINDLAMNTLGAVTPDFIKKPVAGAVSKLVGAAANTGIGKSAIQGVSDFSTAHPELSGDIGAVGNIVGAAGLVTGAGAAKDAIGGAVGKAFGKDALSSVIDDISPTIKAGSTKGAAYAKTVGNVKDAFGNITRSEDPAMREAATVVKEAVPNFDRLPTFTDKLNAVKQGVVNFAQQLRKNLGGEVQPLLQREDIDALREQIAAEMAKNPYVAKGADEADKILNEFVRRLPQTGDINMEHVLDARQGLDSWIKSLKGENIFDPAKENAISIGLRAVRQGANHLMESKVPSAGVKALLKKQTLLYDAMDGLAAKADAEVGTGFISRAAKAHPNITRALKYAGGAIGTGLGIKEGQNLLGP